MKDSEKDIARIHIGCLPTAESIVSGMTVKQILTYIDEPDAEYAYPDHYIMAVRKVNGFLAGGIVTDSMRHE